MNFYPFYKKISLIVLISGAMLLSSNNALAQDLPDPCTSPDVECPIDGGLSLLIAAGIGLGAKKAYDRKRAAIKNAE